MDFAGMNAAVFAIIGVAIAVGWVATTWLKIKNGYPLET
jgi:hypothetical protein